MILDTYDLVNGLKAELVEFWIVENYIQAYRVLIKENGTVVCTLAAKENPIDAILLLIELGLLIPAYNDMNKWGYPIEIFDQTLPDPKPTKDVVEGIRQNRHKVRLDYWDNIKQSDKGLFNHNMDGDPYDSYRTIAGDFVSKLTKREFKKLLAHILINVLWDRYQSK